MAQVADGVQAAHSLDVLHRDLKPGNILLTDVGDTSAVADELPRFCPKVADFGLAREGVPIEASGSGDSAGSSEAVPPARNAATSVGSITRASRGSCLPTRNAISRGSPFSLST